MTVQCSCVCMFADYDACICSLAVRSSMPDFYEKMKSRLRTEAQGADTVVWLAVSKEAIHHASGCFFQGERGLCPSAQKW